MHLSSGAIWQGWKSPVHAPCHQHGCRDFRAASLGAVQWLYRWSVRVCVCTSLIGSMKSLPLTFASDLPREMSWTALAFVAGLCFPSLHTTAHFLMFSSSTHPKMPRTCYSILSPPASHWSETVFCKRKIRGSWETCCLTKLSLLAERQNGELLGLIKRSPKPQEWLSWIPSDYSPLEFLLWNDFPCGLLFHASLGSDCAAPAACLPEPQSFCNCFWERKCSAVPWFWKSFRNVLYLFILVIANSGKSALC